MGDAEREPFSPVQKVPAARYIIMKQGFAFKLRIFVLSNMFLLESWAPKRNFFMISH